MPASGHHPAVASSSARRSSTRSSARCSRRRASRSGSASSRAGSSDTGIDPAPYHYVILDFFATPEGDPTPRAGDDAADARWVPLAEVPALDLVAGLFDFLVRIGSLRAVRTQRTRPRRSRPSAAGSPSYDHDRPDRRRRRLGSRAAAAGARRRRRRRAARRRPTRIADELADVARPASPSSTPTGSPSSCEGSPRCTTSSAGPAATPASTSRPTPPIPARGARMQTVEERATVIGTKLLFFELEWAELDDDARRGAARRRPPRVRRATTCAPRAGTGRTC